MQNYSLYLVSEDSIHASNRGQENGVTVVVTNPPTTTLPPTTTTTTEIVTTTLNAEKCGPPDICGPKLGDGFCDDECNFPDCAYDGGDCCKVGADKSRCTDCLCKGDTQCPPICVELKGEGTCDDICNTLNCEYDGGDCCGGNVQCGPMSSDCQCLDPSFTTAVPATTTISTTSTTTSQEEGPCTCNDIPTYNKVGDGNCDDDCNVAECEYDGGDCCDPDAVKRLPYCYDCICKENGGE